MVNILVKKKNILNTSKLPAACVCYLSIAGEGGVVKQEVSTKEHHNRIIYTKYGPINEDGPPQQRVLSNISVKGITR